jgi:Fe-S oxidoreductase
MDFFLRRKVRADARLAERIFQCTSCGACEVVCHSDIKIPFLWEDVRNWLNLQGLGPMGAHRAMYQRITKLKNPFNEPTENRDKWLPPDIELASKPEVVFFAGCTESYRKQDLARASVRVLARAGVPFTLLGKDEWCCCSPLLRTGQRDVVEEFVRHLVDSLRKIGCRELVTTCSGCYVTISRDHSQILGGLPFKVYHLSQYVERLLKKGKIQLTKPVKKKVTYHDPCHLGRHGKVFDPPRKVLGSIPDLKLVEMPRNRENSRCCGAGGGMKAAFKDIAESIASGRVKEAKEVGAELIVTNCPFCVYNLNDGAKRINEPIPTVDMVELVLEAL